MLWKRLTAYGSLQCRSRSNWHFHCDGDFEENDWLKRLSINFLNCETAKITKMGNGLHFFTVRISVRMGRPAHYGQEKQRKWSWLKYKFFIRLKFRCSMIFCNFISYLIMLCIIFFFLIYLTLWELLIILSSSVMKNW